MMTTTNEKTPLPPNDVYPPIYQSTTIEILNDTTTCEIFWNAFVFVVIIMLFLVLGYLYYAQNL